MTDIPQTAAPAGEGGRSVRHWATALALALIVALGDLLFWSHEPGISVALFFTGLILAVVASNWRSPLDARLVAFTALALLTVAPMLEDVTPWAVLVALCGLGLLALGATRQLPAFEDWFGAALRFGLLAPFRLAGDGVRAITESRGAGTDGAVMRRVAGWLVPLAFAMVFVALFAAANPVIDIAIHAVRLDQLFAQVEAGRIVFWAVLAVGCWPFLAPRLLRWLPAPEVQGPSMPRPDGALFGRAAITNSLVVFNAIFAVQTAMDLMYLWGGLRLPDNLGYAEYAHRGAYPLIVTALLAAAFVLAAMRRGGPGESSAPIRALVYLWVAQNVWLVISALLRLKLYVEQYQLSELRIAAGVWMLLVAVGLVLIVAKIALRLSNRWLVTANLTCLAVALWAMAWVDVPATIATYNVEHSLEVTGQGEPVDIRYLASLGTGVIPALDEFLARGVRASPHQLDAAWQARQNLGHREMVDDGNVGTDLRPLDWREWTWRTARLRDYVQSHPFAAPPQGR